ncbi:MAG: hypothetical protein ACRCZE_01850 [Candidatus Altimarinota bacterium]
MENRNSNPDLANISQNYTTLHLGDAAISAIENWEILAAALRNASPEQGLSGDLAKNYTDYLDSINEAIQWYSSHPSRFVQIKTFLQQSFQNLYATKQTFLSLDQEDFFYESLSRIGIGVTAFNKSDFENIFLDKIKAFRQSQSDISSIQNDQNSLSTTAASGLYRKIADPNTGSLKDVTTTNGQHSGNGFAAVFEDEPTNPERFDSEVTVIKSSPVGQRKPKKVETIMGLGDEESDPVNRARVRRRAASRRALTFQGLGAINPDHNDRPTPIQPIPITAPSGSRPSTIQESVEQAVKAVGRTITRTFPAVQSDVPAEAGFSFPKDSQATMHSIPTEALLHAAGLDKSKIDLDEPTTVDETVSTKQEISVEEKAPVSRKSLVTSNSQASFADHIEDIHIGAQPEGSLPPESKVIFDPNRISQPNIEQSTPKVERDSSSKLPFAPTLLDPATINAGDLQHPPLIPQDLPLESVSPWSNRSKMAVLMHEVDPISHPTTQPISQNQQEVEKLLQDNKVASPMDYLRSLPSSHFDHPTEQSQVKKGFWKSLKESAKETWNSAKKSLSNFSESIGRKFKKAVPIAIGAAAVIGGLFFAFKKDAVQNDKHTDQTNINTAPSAVNSTENRVEAPAPKSVVSPNQTSDNSENTIYKIDQDSPAFQAYVTRLEKLKVSGIANMIREIAPQVQLRHAATSTLQSKYQANNQDFLTGDESVDQQRAEIFKEFLETALEAKYSNSGINNFVKVHQRIFDLYLSEGTWRPEWKETKNLYDAFVQPLKLQKEADIAGFKPNSDLSENDALRAIKKSVPSFYEFYQQAIDQMDEDPSEYNDLNSISTKTCQKIKLVIDAYVGSPDRKNGGYFVHNAWCADPSREGLFKESLRKTVPVRKSLGSSTKPINYTPKATPATQPKHTYNQSKSNSINKTAQLKTPTQKSSTLRDADALKQQIPMYSWREILKGYFWG